MTHWLDILGIQSLPEALWCLALIIVCLGPVLALAYLLYMNWSLNEMIRAMHFVNEYVANGGSVDVAIHEACKKYVVKPEELAYQVICAERDKS